MYTLNGIVQANLKIHGIFKTTITEYKVASSHKIYTTLYPTNKILFLCYCVCGGTLSMQLPNGLTQMFRGHCVGPNIHSVKAYMKNLIMPINVTLTSGFGTINAIHPSCP